MAIKPEAFMTERHDLVTYVLPDPAVGTALEWFIPEGLVVQIVAVRFRLTTSVNAGLRLAVVFLQDVADVTVPISPGYIEQTVSLAWIYDFSTGIAPLDHTINHDWLFQPLACCYQGKEGDRLVINADGLDVADQIDGANIRCFVWKAD